MLLHANEKVTDQRTILKCADVATAIASYTMNMWTTYDAWLGLPVGS